jgi:hypothetical protein
MLADTWFVSLRLRASLLLHSKLPVYTASRQWMTRTFGLACGSRLVCDTAPA